MPGLLALVVSAPVLAQDRVFDIVPPAGSEVERVDGYTVLRQSGRQYGAVLTYMPESESAAWIPVAVLNTSGGRLKVGTRGVGARSGETELKVWSTAGLIRLAKEGGISTPAARADASSSGTLALTQNHAPVAPSKGDTIGPDQPEQQSQGVSENLTRPIRSNAQQREHDLAVAQVTALRNRLFRDQTLDPREVGRGDVRITLPPRRSDGQPAEFVLTLKFGGEAMDITYRERVAR